jgi:hypothetical protein
MNNNQVIVRQLLAADDVNINFQDANGDTALILGNFII